MDIMDIQAVESKLSDVTVTPIPRSQVQNFYNYQQQREQREQQPQIQISAIHHAPRERSNNNSNSTASGSTSNVSSGNSATDLLINSINAGGTRDLFISTNSSGSSNNKRANNSNALKDFQQTNVTTSAAAAMAALQYTQQLQAQLALLQQQANTTALPTTLRNSNSSNNNAASSSNNGITSQLKYPQSSSPLSQTASALNLSTASMGALSGSSAANGVSKYAQLLSIIEEMGREIRPTYTGSRSSTERLKRAIVHARILVRECLVETERSARQ